MKLLHTSDWHLGLSLHQAPLVEEQQDFIDQLLAIIDREGVEAVLLAGDVFDHAVSSAQAIAQYSRAMEALCLERGLPVLLIAGNHDGAARLASCGALLSRAGLHIAGRLTREVDCVPLQDVMIHMLPYFNTDEARYLYPEDKIEDYEAAMRRVVEGIPLEAGYRHILLAHCFVGGAALSESDRAASVGGANQVGAAVFQRFDYVALGHLHRAQWAGPNVRYSGSPLKYSFAEAGYQKSVTLIDTQDMAVRELPIMPKRDLRVVRGAFEEIMTGAKADAQAQDYLRIELTDSFASLEKLQWLREYYPNLLNLVGRSLEMEKGQDSLEVAQLERLSDSDVLLHFYRDILQSQPDEQELRWFTEALARLEREEGGGAS